MYSGASTTALPVVGFPIRKSRGQRLVSTSPELIAAAHVLLRLLAPRHPPCALILLIEKNSLVTAMEFSRCARTLSAMPEETGNRSLKTQQRSSRSTLLLGELGTGRQKPSNWPSAYQGKCPGIPRKEVIQPQLPLRLPCYDFTPIIDPTLDGSLPYGLGHRLRVLPTFVV
jgi:hypothetical protein